MKKVIGIFIILIMLFIPNFSKAGILDDVLSDGDNFISNGVDGTYNSDAAINTEMLKEASSDVYNILLYIGIALDVLIGAIIGIKFILASIEEKAKVKEALIPYVIGSAVIFGAFAIWKVTVNILSGI